MRISITRAVKNGTPSRLNAPTAIRPSKGTCLVSFGHIRRIRAAREECDKLAKRKKFKKMLKGDQQRWAYDCWASTQFDFIICLYSANGKLGDTFARFSVILLKNNSDKIDGKSRKAPVCGLCGLRTKGLAKTTHMNKSK